MATSGPQAAIVIVCRETGAREILTLDYPSGMALTTRSPSAMGPRKWAPGCGTWRRLAASCTGHRGGRCAGPGWHRGACRGPPDRPGGTSRRRGSLGGLGIGAVHLRRGHAGQDRPLGDGSFSGSRLAQETWQQAWTLGTTFLYMRQVEGLSSEDSLYRLRFSGGGVLTSRTVVIATGAAYRRLGIANVEALQRGGASPLTPCSSSSARGRGRNGSARASHATSGGSSLPGQTCRATPPPTGIRAGRRCRWRRACPGCSRPVTCAGDQSRGSRPRWARARSRSP